MWVTSRWIIDRLKYFKSEFNTHSLRGKMDDVMALGRWAVREHFFSRSYLWKYLSECSQILHTGGLVVPFGVYKLWPTFGSQLWPIYTFWRPLRFQSRSRKVLGRSQSYCTYMFSRVRCCTLNLKLTQHFDLIYDIGKSDWNILRKIMKTAQDSYTITIKQIVRFQERMHLKKFQVDKIQNGRPSAITHLDRPDIAEYHENRSR